MPRYFEGDKFDQPYELFRDGKPYDISLLGSPDIKWEWDDGKGNTHTITFTGAQLAGEGGVINKVLFPISPTETALGTDTKREYKVQVKVLDGSVLILHEKRINKLTVEKPVGA